MIEDFANDIRIFDGADNSNFATAFRAEGDVDIENPLEELSPGDSAGLFWFLILLIVSC